MPVSDARALFTEPGLGFNNGDANAGQDYVFFQTVFQPVLPIKLAIIPVIPDLIKQPLF